MTKRKKKPISNRGTSEPQWKTVEKVVALLEKSLAPEARVRHNVKLPCLTTGHDEQCDVVIEMGQEPRVTWTIVEVQKRNERVKPNDFRGWCQKMRDIGANRLICVSEKPFPRSIKDKVAKELGPTVLLVRLEVLQANQWPFQIVNNAMTVYKSKVDVDGTIKPNPLLIFDPDQNPFQEYIGELFSAASLPNVIRREGLAELLPVKDVIDEGVRLMNRRPKFIRLPEGVHRVRMFWKPKGVSFCFNGKTAPIQKVRADYTVETRCVHFPFEISSYTQEGHDTLAWVVRATGKVDGEDAEIRFSCVPTADGGFSMTYPQVLGIKEGVFFFWGHSGERARGKPHS
ncbi:MAG TPA: hypothetical protein VMP01_19835 [Pirellulaceae bacterium]|nr:hypothetical protein [Pirellulaceae bacterium]